jgi:hypothetical protein
MKYVVAAIAILVVLFLLSLLAHYGVDPMRG